MKILSRLKEYENVLTDPVECSFFQAGYNPFVKGQYQGYDAEFGVEISGGNSTPYSYDNYCKIEFKRPPEVPFYISSKLTLDNFFSNRDGRISGDYFALKYNWLYIYHGGPFPLSKKGLENYLKNLTSEDLRWKFNRLIERMKQIECGNFNIRPYGQRQATEELKTIIVYGFIAVIVTALVWWYLS
jgi:hypothetical protein